MAGNNSEEFFLTRVYTGTDGLTHFESTSLPLYSRGKIGALSDSIGGASIEFRTNPADYEYDWHAAPRRQFVVMLDGEIEIETGDGEKRRFASGDVILLEDTEGQGHRTRNTGGTRRRSLFVATDAEIPLRPAAD